MPNKQYWYSGLETFWTIFLILKILTVKNPKKKNPIPSKIEDIRLIIIGINIYIKIRKNIYVII